LERDEEQRAKICKEIFDLEKLVDLENNRVLSKDNSTGKQEKFDNIIKILTTSTSVLGTILPIVLYSYWVRRGFEFEEKGTLTSRTFSSLLQKFKL